MPSPSSQQADRILALLYVLLNAEQGLTREEIWQRVPAYQEAPTESARRRVFEHDMEHLKASPFCVEIDWRLRNKPALYRARFRKDESDGND